MLISRSKWHEQLLAESLLCSCLQLFERALKFVHRIVGWISELSEEVAPISLVSDGATLCDVGTLPVQLMTCGELREIAEPHLDQPFGRDIQGHRPETEAREA